VLKKVRVSNDIEKKIVIACIVSDNFLQQTSKIIKLNLLKIEFSKIVVKWCFDYYKEFQKAPKETIEEIYIANKDEIEPAVAKSVSLFLQKLSKEYEEESNFNVDYRVKRCREYMEILAYEDLFAKGKGLLAQNKVGKIKKLLKEHKDVAKDISDTVNPFDVQTIRSFFQEDEANTLFSFDGPIGDLIGPLKRGWLFGIMAPMKRGKSFWLGEILVQALFNKLKVLYVSFEMTKNDLQERIYTRLTGLPMKPGTIVYPVLDCKRNQTGSCRKKSKYVPDRANDPVLMEREDQEKPDFASANPKYRVCTYCRDNNKRGYVPEYWFISKVYNKVLNTKTIENKLHVIVKRFGDNIRFKFYPSHTASMSDILECMDALEYNEGFIPDVVITDYADLMKPDFDSYSNEERSGINNIWRAHKMVAQLRDCLVCTVTQSGRKTIDAKNVRAKDAADDIRKMAHVNIMATLSQQEKEKMEGIMRFGVVEHRHRKFIESRQVTVLECRDLGLAMIDSEWINVDNDQKKADKKTRFTRNMI